MAYVLIRNEEEEIIESADRTNSSTVENRSSENEGQSLKGGAVLTDVKQRLKSLDVFRGLTVALMILVDDAGGALPAINHSPWDGVTLADFVMPFFLFIVGVALGLVYKKVTNKVVATQKAILRAIKLFLLGVILQGGYFHGLNNLTYGVDLEHIRWLGILQRISIGYFLAAMCEIWMTCNCPVDSFLGFVKKYYLQWVFAAVLSTAYLGCLYGLYVPDWEFELPMINFYGTPSNAGSEMAMVKCGVRGSLEPACNAVRMIDYYVLGVKHLYQNPMYKRTKECSVKSPDYGPSPENAPIWCQAPFDPEGLLSTIMASVTCFIGLNFGHILVNFKGQWERLYLWTISSFVLILIGIFLEMLGMPLNKPLYTFSYMCVTSGTAGFLFAAIYLFVDVYGYRRPTVLLEWMGLNALIIYALAACDLFAAAIQGFYWSLPKNNIVNAVELLIQGILHSKRFVDGKEEEK
ncbi:hypothetical protein SUGI_0099490 [Cryptomeria japonica]|nr:hypothetical protein SUGI_0099490 [Cryptomeria japonica]